MLDISLDKNIFVTDELTAAIQELNMLFNTDHTELIGDSTYGTNFEQFLWTLTPMTNYLIQYIEKQISKTYFLSKFNVTVDAEFETGTERSIYYVKIGISNPQTNKELVIQQYTLN